MVVADAGGGFEGVGSDMIEDDRERRSRNIQRVAMGGCQPPGLMKELT